MIEITLYILFSLIFSLIIYFIVRFFLTIDFIKKAYKLQYRLGKHNIEERYLILNILYFKFFKIVFSFKKLDVENYITYNEQLILWNAFDYNLFSLKLLQSAKISYNCTLDLRPSYLDGMCYHMYNNSVYTNSIFIKCHSFIRNHIPEFNELFLIGAVCERSTFWWNRDDIKSRLEAFDRLISIYEEKVNNRTFHLSDVPKEELLKRRIDAYSYLL